MNCFNFLFVSILFGSCILINSQQICNVASNRLGKCIPIDQCNTPETATNNSLCDSSNVCCDLSEYEQINECITPNNDRGVCVDIDKCPTLSKLLDSKQFSKIGIKYLTMSKCKDFESFSVCCSGKAPDFTVVYEEYSKDYNNNVEADLLLPTPEQCSNINDEIGENVIGIAQYSWMAQIGYRTVKNRTKNYCSAILISKQYLITAGHCVDEDAFVHVGDPINVRIGEIGDIFITIPIEQIILHPKYFSSDFLENSSIKKNDIALIRIKDATPFTDFIKPICLPSSDLARKSSAQDLKVIARSRNDFITKKINYDANIENLHLCQNYIQAMNPNISLWYKQLCAKFGSDEELCNFNSGNPLLTENDNTHFLIGINNMQKNPCKRYDDPVVFTKISPYIPWIRNTIKP